VTNWPATTGWLKLQVMPSLVIDVKVEAGHQGGGDLLKRALLLAG
jgi:hypothetical protein